MSLWQQSKFTIRNNFSHLFLVAVKTDLFAIEPAKDALGIQSNDEIFPQN